MENLLPHQYEFIDSTVSGAHNFRSSAGGHMSYRRMLFENSSNQPYFVKAHDPAQFQESWREEEMRNFLVKEGRLYDHLTKSHFAHIPERYDYSDDVLVLSGLIPEQGWHWRAPKDPALRATYIADVIAALTELEDVPAFCRQSHDEIAIDVFYNHGWDKLHDLDVPALIDQNINKWQDNLLPESVEFALSMQQSIGRLSVKRAQVTPTVLNHHDARQANIAWHPELGVRLVDWSWADQGLVRGDSTMFLLDLHKAGYDISPYSELINPVYAKMVLGYWLQRSATAHSEGNKIVRMHQFISALKTAEFILETE